VTPRGLRRHRAPATVLSSIPTARRVLGGVLTLTAMATRSACPGLSSHQVVASAGARCAGCKGTDAWSRGAR